MNATQRLPQQSLQLGDARVGVGGCGLSAEFISAKLEMLRKNVSVENAISDSAPIFNFFIKRFRLGYQFSGHHATANAMRR